MGILLRNFRIYWYAFSGFMGTSFRKFMNLWASIFKIFSIYGGWYETLNETTTYHQVLSYPPSGLFYYRGATENDQRRDDSLSTFKSFEKKYKLKRKSTVSWGEAVLTYLFGRFVPLNMVSFLRFRLRDTVLFLCKNWLHNRIHDCHF